MSDELRRTAEHVVYELDMMRHCSGAIRASMPNSGNRNAFVEAFLLHCRNLQDFLSPRPTAREDDITVGLYLDKGLHYQIQPPPSAYRRQIDKHLSHITAERVVSPSPGWPIDQLLAQIENAWARFMEELNETHPEGTPWFGDK